MPERERYVTVEMPATGPGSVALDVCEDCGCFVASRDRHDRVCPAPEAGRSGP